MLLCPVGHHGLGGVEQRLVLRSGGGQLGGDGQPGEAGLGVGRIVGRVDQLGRGDKGRDPGDLAAVLLDGERRTVALRRGQQRRLDGVGIGER